MTALLITLFLPLLGSLLLLLVNSQNTKLIKSLALAFSLVTFVVSAILMIGFDPSDPNFKYLIDIVWIPSIDAGFRIGLQHFYPR